MTTKKKIAVACGALVTIALVVLLILWLRGQGPGPAEPTVSPTSDLKTRKAGNDRFGPRARAQNTANVDVGIRTVSTLKNSPSPAPSARAAAQVLLAQAVTPTPGQQDTLSSPQASATPLPAAPVAPAPLREPPKFAPLPPPPAAQGKETIIVYAKGETGKRQVFVRSLERDNDDQLVTSVFDDFGVSLSSSAQKVAYYSNEEGPSDASRPRSKLKVVDLATGKVFGIATDLPGVWPVAWSADGKRLAIPTTNSIFIADMTTGSALQVPTAKNPGGIVWAPGNLKIYFQAEVGTQTDLFEAEAITAQARPVVTTPVNERYPSVSPDGAKLTYLREQGQNKTAAVVVRPAAGGEELTFSESQPVESYLWNLDFTEMMVVRVENEPLLTKVRGRNVTELPNILANPTLVAWDRDYQHVFVLADDDQGKALFSVDTTSGEAEKIKAGIPESTPPAAR